MESKSLDYALLVGQGRSGTNFLLGLLDASASTHCRNEPDQLHHSAMGRLRPYRFFADDGPELGPLWDYAVRGAALTTGPRDHLCEQRKEWIHRGAQRLGFQWLRNRYRLVHRLRPSGRKMDARECAYPRWMVAPEKLERAYHVFKLNAACGLTSWMLDQRPQARAIQIVRHPGGFVRSWLRRWVQGSDARDRRGCAPGEPRDADRLREAARREHRWAKLFGDIDRLSRVEAELWWWRYCTETVMEAGAGHPHYKLVVYEELAERPLEVARDVYDFCGLAWDETVAGRVSALTRDSARIAHAWKRDLSADAVGAIERVLDRSPLSAVWGHLGDTRAA